MATGQIPLRSNPLVDAAGVIGNLAPLVLGSGKQQGTTKVTDTKQGLDPAILALLQKQLASGQYSKDAAVKDSKAVMDANIRQIMEKFLPQISSQRVGAGVYNDTTTALLQNDLTARAAGEAAKVQAETVKDYATINNQTANVIKDANVVQTRNVNTTSKTAAPIDNPLLAAGGLLATMATPSILGAIGKAIFSDSGSDTGDSPFGRKRSGNNDSFDSSSMDMASLITPVFESNNFGSNMSALLEPIAKFVAAPDSGTSGIFNYTDTGSLGNFAGNVAGEVGAGSGIVDSIGSALSNVDVSGFFGDLFSGISEGCFITTAVCEVMELPDDCHVLQTLRKFRDAYMKTDPQRAKLVADYYIQAPGIVAALATLEDVIRDDLYESMYVGYILPAVEAIESGNNEKALLIYTDLFRVAEREANRVVVREQLANCGQIL